MGGRVGAVLAGVLLVCGVVLPQAAAGAAPVVVATHHVVKPGETLLGIAGMHGLRYLDIARWNGVRPPYEIWEDETLRLTRPSAPLPGFSTRVEIVTPEMVAWNAAKGCPVEPAELRRIWVSYLDFDGNYRDGNLIMHRRNVARTQRAFKRLYYTKFRIQVMAPMEVNAPRLTDIAALTSGWECRTVSSGSSTVWSQHAYGNAIDLNPVQNPMVEDRKITPPNGAGYVRRGLHRRGMVHAGGAVVALTSNGFPWGGRWKTLKDYMHFSTTFR